MAALLLPGRKWPAPAPVRHVDSLSHVSTPTSAVSTLTAPAVGFAPSESMNFLTLPTSAATWRLSQAIATSVRISYHPSPRVPGCQCLSHNCPASQAPAAFTASRACDPSPRSRVCPELIPTQASATWGYEHWPTNLAWICFLDTEQLCGCFDLELLFSEALAFCASAQRAWMHCARWVLSSVEPLKQGGCHHRRCARAARVGEERRLSLRNLRGLDVSVCVGSGGGRPALGGSASQGRTAHTVTVTASSSLPRGGCSFGGQGIAQATPGPSWGPPLSPF
jgi:hypothetical protein